MGYRLDFTEDQRELTITFTIVEGTRYVIESLSFEGNTVLTNEELRPLTNLEPGKPILQRNLDKSVDAVREKYGELGYIYAMVNGNRVFSETPGFVRITIGIQEGDTYTVGRIVVRGNERTQDKVVRRALNLYPDDVLNMTELKQAEETLQQTQLFSLASVSPVGNQGKVRDILINVQEGRKKREISCSVSESPVTAVSSVRSCWISRTSIFSIPQEVSQNLLNSNLSMVLGNGCESKHNRERKLTGSVSISPNRISWTSLCVLTSVPICLNAGENPTMNGEQAAASVLGKGSRRDFSRIGIRNSLSASSRSMSGIWSCWPPETSKDAEGSNMQTSIKRLWFATEPTTGLSPPRRPYPVFYEQYGIMGGEGFRQTDRQLHLA